MQGLDAAIMRTVLYADIFRFAMTVEEIHHFLISDSPVTLEAVRRALAVSPSLHQHLCMSDGYVALDPAYIALRIERARITPQMWAGALRYGRWLARLPFVRMVALTGALAMHNPSDARDDLDYLLVTARGRVWLARAGAVLLVRLARLRGVILCPNYVVAEDALAQTRRDLYIAHEVTQAVPLYGEALYAALRAANRWTEDHLPNARAAFRADALDGPRSPWGVLKGGVEWALSGPLGDQLEQWEQRRKLRRFARDLRTPHSAAALDSSQVKGHFRDHGHRVLSHYHDRLARYGLLDADADAPGQAGLPLAGD